MLNSWSLDRRGSRRWSFAVHTVIVLVILVGGVALALPSQVAGVSFDGDELRWNGLGPGVTYAVYRGALEQVGGGQPASCRAPSLAGTRLNDAAVPSVGTGWYYLITGIDTEGEGSAGNSSDGSQPRGVEACVTGQAGGVSVHVVAATARESDGTIAQFEIRRDAGGSLPQIEVDLAWLGNDDPRRGSADAGDVQLTDAQGGLVGSSVVLADGVDSMRIDVTPVADGATEVPETLQLQLLGGGAGYGFGASTAASIEVVDAPATQEFQRLFIGFLNPAVGVDSFASGLMIARLAGDNRSATVDVDFSGLTSLQSAVHIQVANPVDGPVIRLLPAVPSTGFIWQLEAAQFLTTDQAVLDALLEGRLYGNVVTANFANGEIRGPLGVQQGSTTLQVPPDPPALPTLSGDDLDRDIVRFLTQATFGPTPTLVDELRGLIAARNGDRIAGMTDWIDAQMDPAQFPPPSLLAYTRASGQLYNDNSQDRRAGWWLFARYGRDQLRQRMAFALSQLLVVSDENAKTGTMHLGASDYYDLLIDGAFSRYRDLLLEVTYHPIMGNYLSHLRNQREQVDSQGTVIVSPDENYAREIMQLFTFGLLHRHLDGTIALDGNGLPVQTYDNGVITELARVFTGLSFSKRDQNGTIIDNNNFNLGLGGNATQVRWTHPMKPFDAFHDVDSKTIFNGQVVPAGMTTRNEIRMVHDLLTQHQTTPPFIARRLIQRFVTSNPSRGYVYRVAFAFQSSGGDLGATLKAILLDYEARSLDVIEDVGYGKQKEPVLRLTALLRLLDASSQVPIAELDGAGFPAQERAKFPDTATLLRPQSVDDISQRPMSAPSVFNFFVPDFKAAGELSQAGLVAPEFQISTQSQIYEFINFQRKLLFRNAGLPALGEPAGYPNDAGDILPNLAPLQALHDAALATGDAASAAEALVDHLDLYFNAGGLRQRYASAPTPNPRSLMIDAVAETTADVKIKNAVYIVAHSPQAAVQR